MPPVTFNNGEPSPGRSPRPDLSASDGDRAMPSGPIFVAKTNGNAHESLLPVKMPS